jgi:hypothetical protein
MKTTLLIVTFLVSVWGAAGTFRVDSVTVDSVWNTDTSLYSQPIARRNAKISYYLAASDSATCFVDVSLDSGKTWMCDRDKMEGIGGKVAFRSAPNKKSSLVMCIYTSDTTGVVFRVTARKDTASIRRCRLSNQVAGWSERDTTQYAYFNDDISLQGIIDGGYQVYTINGMIDGFRQSMATTDTLHFCTIMAYDFGLFGRAADVYGNVIERWTRKSTLVCYDSTVAVVKPVLGGYSVAAHFRHFYVELGITGYGVNSADSLAQRDAAKAEAINFLNYYEQKSNQQ